MKLRNKKTGLDGELHYEPDKEYHFTVATEDPADMAIYRTLAELSADWEDYTPAEPIFDDEKVSKAIRAWLSIQVQPIEAVSILCSKDNDGFFSYHLYGYIAKARIVDGKAVVNNNLTAIGFDFRSDVYFEHGRRHDYTIAELCGEEEE